jgi:hypothetical protein
MIAVHFQCPKCANEIVMGSKFWGKHIKCSRCGITLIVPASDGPAPTIVPSTASESGTDAIGPAVSKWENLRAHKAETITVLAGTILIGAMLTWFFLRDTWQTDNFEQITQRCEAVQTAVAHSDDDAAATAYAELDHYISDHKLTNAVLAQRVREASPYPSEVFRGFSAIF